VVVVVVVVVVVIVGAGVVVHFIVPQSHSPAPTQLQLAGGRAHIGLAHLVVVVVVVEANFFTGAAVVVASSVWSSSASVGTWRHPHDPALGTVPAAHAFVSQAASPAPAWTNPAAGVGHAAQVVWPAVLWWYPTGQSPQLRDAASMDTRPGWHFSHASAPATLDSPAAHAAQAYGLSWLCARKRPGAQATHGLSSVARLRPAGHVCSHQMGRVGAIVGSAWHVRGTLRKMQLMRVHSCGLCEPCFATSW
jgi:hypothetical protein